MASFMAASTCCAVSRADSAGTPAAASPSAIASGVNASMTCSPTPGVCHCCAMSCQTYSASAGPLPHAQVRTRSGRSETSRCTSSAPQSWPTRSTGAPTRSISRASQSTYASLLAAKPGGRAHPKPGSDGVMTSVRRRRARIGAVRPALLRAVVAAEDGRFFAHHGVDWAALRRAREYNERWHGRRLRGAGTITMQCARTVFLWPGRSYVRKALEVYFAYLLELTWGKRRILEVYVNTVEWGDRVYGVEGAAQRYFGLPAARGDAWQSALLAAVLPNPRRWSPAAPTPYPRARAAIIAAPAGRVRLSPHRQHDAEPRLPPHHAPERLVGPRQWKGLDHGTDSRRRREPQRLLRV